MQIPLSSTQVAAATPAGVGQPNTGSENPQRNPTSGVNFAGAAQSKDISEAIANYVLQPGWNEGGPEKVCGNMATAKETISTQLKQSAWQQELDQLKKDVQAALLKTYQFGTRLQETENAAQYARLKQKLADHVQAGPAKYVGDFAPFMPDMATCMATRGKAPSR